MKHARSGGVASACDCIGRMARLLCGLGRRACGLLRGCRLHRHGPVQASDLQRLAECDILWEMRNTIFKENGYCFHTPKAIAAFGNAGCLYDEVEAVPLNAIERDNVATIKSVERRKGCNE
jgi:YARHG domain